MQRMAIFYAAASLSGAFSGLLAYGIEHMEGVAGRHGWQWIFIIEGLIPVAMSSILYFILPDSPETAKFLTKDEKEFLINRLALETGSGQGRVTNSDKIQFKHIKAAFSEWKIWGAVVMFWANTIGTYGQVVVIEQVMSLANQSTRFTATVPAIVQDLGYSSANAQLMTIPIYVFAVICVLVVACKYHHFCFLGSLVSHLLDFSERIRQRTPFIMGGFSVAIVGLVGGLVTRRYPSIPGASYFFLFLIAAGFYSPFICIVCLIGNNLAPSSKRAVGMALLISVGNMGGIAGSNIFLAAQAPEYPTGFGTGIAICCCAIAMAYVLRVAYRKENEKRDRLMTEKSDDEIRAMYTEQELLDLGDRSPFFRYTL